VRQYRNITREYLIPTSTAKWCKGAEDTYMVGALARFNLNPGLLSPRAKAAAKKLGLSAPCHNPFMITIAQLVECIHSVDDSISLIDRLLTRGVRDEAVLRAMRTVPRHLFVQDALAPQAYDDRPQPIGHGQTISQPYIVARMTELLEVKPGMKVLEIGTGSGYQAAVAAEMGGRITSIEIIEPLAREAAERLRRLGYGGITTRVGDGYHGWPERGPYDAILVTAAASHVPPPLVQQLKPGGRMVIPVGAPFQGQQLLMIEKQADGSLRSRQLMAVSFVPLTGRRD